MGKKEDILNLAQELIQSQGIDAVSFRTLADGVGVKSSSVHYHFSTKDDLLFALMERYTIQFRKQLQKLGGSRLNAIGRIEALAGLFQSTAKQDKLCLCAAMCSISRRLDEKTLLASQQFVEELTTWVETNIEMGQANGDIDAKMSPGPIAQSIVALLEGALLLDGLSAKESSLKNCGLMIRKLLD